MNCFHQISRIYPHSFIVFFCMLCFLNLMRDFWFVNWWILRWLLFATVTSISWMQFRLWFDPWLFQIKSVYNVNVISVTTKYCIFLVYFFGLVKLQKAFRSRTPWWRFQKSNKFPFVFLSIFQHFILLCVFSQYVNTSMANCNMLLCVSCVVGLRDSAKATVINYMETSAKLQLIIANYMCGYTYTFVQPNLVI